MLQTLQVSTELEYIQCVKILKEKRELVRLIRLKGDSGLTTLKIKRGNKKDGPKLSFIPKSFLCLSALVAIVKCHKWGSLKIEINFSQFWRLKVKDQVSAWSSENSLPGFHLLIGSFHGRERGSSALFF